MTRPIASETAYCCSRRAFLGSAGAFVAWANLPSFARASSHDPRLFVVILRGALDGLAVVPPIGDPGYSALRGDLDVGSDPSSAKALDGFFVLNGSMPALHALYKSGEALIVHAAATPYRDRSHFDGQDVLENGSIGPRAEDTGWLNRAVAALPAGDRVAPRSGLAAGSTIPLILRGPAPVLSWTPPDFSPPSAGTIERLLDLYQHSDPELAAVLQAGTRLSDMADSTGGASGGKGKTGDFRRLAEGSSRLIADDAGPRIAALSYEGWDTHANEGANGGRLGKLLSALDGAFDGMRKTLAPVWRETVVLVITEFGRTAHENGSEGTDHGTATTAFLMGGAVKGGRVLADWPGLKPAQLFEGRDLAPTTDLRAVMKGVLRDHLGLSERVLATKVFPDSLGVRPLDGLIA